MTADRIAMTISAVVLEVKRSFHLSATLYLGDRTLEDIFPYFLASVDGPEMDQHQSGNVEEHLPVAWLSFDLVSQWRCYHQDCSVSLSATSGAVTLLPHW